MQHAVRRLALVVAVTLALPGAASAVEVQPSVEGTANYTDNLFSNSSDRAEDVYFSIAPGVAVSDEGGQLQWRLAYQPSYLFYNDFDDLNGWNHDVDAAASWNITPRTTVRVANRFLYLNSISRLNEASELAGAPAGVETIEARGNLDPFIRNIGTVGVEYMLGRRTFLDASYTNSILDFEDDSRVDRANQGARLGLNHLLRKNLRMGLRLSWSQSELKPTNAPSRTGNFYNASVTAFWTPRPRTTLLASAGPALVMNEATNTSFTNPPVFRYPVQVRGGETFFTRLTTCPQLADGTFYLEGGCQPSVFPAVANAIDNIPQTGAATSLDDSDVTYFADIRFTQGWDHWKLDLFYTRRDDSGVSTGVSGVSNVGGARLEYEPAPRWLLVLGASYVLQESTTDNLVNVLTLTEANRVPLDFPPVIAVSGAGLEVAQSTTRRLIQVTGKREIRTFGTFFDARYQLTERVRLRATFFWTDRESEFDGARLGKYDRFTTVLGITYQFAPFTL